MLQAMPSRSRIVGLLLGQIMIRSMLLAESEQILQFIVALSEDGLLWKDSFVQEFPPRLLLLAISLAEEPEDRTGSKHGVGTMYWSPQQRDIWEQERDQGQGELSTVNFSAGSVIYRK